MFVDLQILEVAKEQRADLIARSEAHRRQQRHLQGRPKQWERTLSFLGDSLITMGTALKNRYTPDDTSVLAGQVRLMQK